MCTLSKGDIATIVEHHIVTEGEDGYSLKIFNAVGDTITVLTVAESAIEPITENEILSVRSFLLLCNPVHLIYQFLAPTHGKDRNKHLAIHLTVSFQQDSRNLCIDIADFGKLFITFLSSVTNETLRSFAKFTNSQS